MRRIWWGAVLLAGLSAVIGCSLVGVLSPGEEIMPDNPAAEPTRGPQVESELEEQLPAAAPEEVQELDLCSLLSEETVSEVLGEPVDASDAAGLASCTYLASGDSLVSLSISAAQGEDAKALTVMGLQLATMFGGPEGVMEQMAVLMEELPGLTVWDVVWQTFEILTELGYQVELTDEFGDRALWGSAPPITTLVLVREDTYLSLNLVNLDENAARQILSELLPLAEQNLPERFTVSMSGQISLGGSSEEEDAPASQLSGQPSVWVAVSGSDQIAAVDPDSMEVTARVDGVDSPHDLAVLGNEIYAASWNAGTAAYVDAGFDVSALYDTGAALPLGVDVNGDFVYITDCAEGVVHVLERESFQPVEDVQVKQCWDVAVGMDFMWVPAGDQYVLQYSLDPWEEIRQIEVGSGPALMEIALDHLWVGCVNDRVIHKVDPVIHRTVQGIRLDPEISMMDMAYGEGFLWVAAADHILRIDANRGEVAGRLDVEFQPMRIAAGHGSLWVTDYFGGALIRLDPATGAVTGTVLVGDEPIGVMVSP